MDLNEGMAPHPLAVEGEARRLYAAALVLKLVVFGSIMWMMWGLLWSSNGVVQVTMFTASVAFLVSLALRQRAWEIVAPGQRRRLAELPLTARRVYDWSAAIMVMFAAVLLCRQGMLGIIVLTILGYLEMLVAVVTQVRNLQRRPALPRELAPPVCAGLLCLAVAWWTVGFVQIVYVGSAFVLPMVVLCVAWLVFRLAVRNLLSAGGVRPHDDG